MIFSKNSPSSTSATLPSPIVASLIGNNVAEDRPDTIYFTYEGQKYSIGMVAYEMSSPIKLPDGRIFLVKGWFETLPPRPIELIPFIQETKSDIVNPVSEEVSAGVQDKVEMSLVTKIYIDASIRDMGLPRDYDYITFSFHDVSYYVGMDAYDKEYDIRLPDGTVLRATGWLESLPPQPSGLILITT